MTRCAQCGGVTSGPGIAPWQECSCFGGPLDEQRARRQQQERERRQQQAAERARQGAA